MSNERRTHDRTTVVSEGCIRRDIVGDLGKDSARHCDWLGFAGRVPDHVQASADPSDPARLDEAPQTDVGVVAGRHDLIARTLIRRRSDVEHGDAIAEVPVGYVPARSYIIGRKPRRQLRDPDEPLRRGPRVTARAPGAIPR